jgi:hypothetical protein
VIPWSHFTKNQTPDLRIKRLVGTVQQGDLVMRPSGF